MSGPDSTLDIKYTNPRAEERARPGVLVVYALDAPRCGALPIEGDALVLGRESLAGTVGEDRSMSRRHARVTFAGGQFQVEDLGSRNGLVLDGVTVGAGQKAAPGGRVLRVGHTVFVLVADLRPYLARPLAASDGEVIGPVLAQAWETIAQIAASSDVLHLHGESGSGKELAARRFHALGPKSKGPFVAINCAAIPEGVAERLFYGARKGAFSGANEDVKGYFESADGGTLFLDEVGELDLAVQAKLLRTLETREVLPIGANAPRKVDLRLVSATHVDLRRAVGSQRFREDLFFRLSRPMVALPPLRERPEEIAWLATRAAARIATSLTPSAGLVEACLLREWPGNVRELTLEVEDAARRAGVQGQLQSLEVEHLDPEAGVRAAAEDAGADGAQPRPPPRALPAPEVIEAALEESGGKVATAARKLGVHRNQLRRWLEARGQNPAE